mmetsp:Transcript_946/g.2448  ORF Transcript_946/g.2448 Transcript_946/m.2448 type:complete len:125 (-) Transcript_946:45-419(-)
MPLLLRNTKPAALLPLLVIDVTRERAISSRNDPTTWLLACRLSYNEVGAEGAKFLAEGLRKNNTLTRLILGNNALDADAKDCLQKAAGEAKAKGVKLKVFVDDAERDFTQEVGRRGVVSAFDLD